jgi:hypothetical protein
VLEDIPELSFQICQTAFLFCFQISSLKLRLWCLGAHQHLLGKMPALRLGNCHRISR